MQIYINFPFWLCSSSRFRKSIFSDYPLCHMSSKSWFKSCFYILIQELVQSLCILDDMLVGNKWNVFCCVIKELLNWNCEKLSLVWLFVSTDLCYHGYLLYGLDYDLCYHGYIPFVFSMCSIFMDCFMRSWR